VRAIATGTGKSGSFALSYPLSSPEIDRRGNRTYSSSSAGYAGGVILCGSANSTPTTDLSKEPLSRILTVASAILVISGFAYVIVVSSEYENPGRPEVERPGERRYSSSAEYAGGVI
jgi:hypothetical protein